MRQDTGWGRKEGKKRGKEGKEGWKRKWWGEGKRLRRKTEKCPPLLYSCRWNRYPSTQHLRRNTQDLHSKGSWQVLGTQPPSNWSSKSATSSKKLPPLSFHPQHLLPTHHTQNCLPPEHARRFIHASITSLLSVSHCGCLCTWMALSDLQTQLSSRSPISPQLKSTDWLDDVQF